MSDCQMDPVRLSALVDGELPADERRSIEAHVAECADCRSTVAALRAVRDGAAALPYEVVAPGEWARVWSALERVLPHVSAGEAPARAREDTRLRVPRIRRQPARLTWRLWMWPRPILAAAALVLALVTGASLIRSMPHRVLDDLDVAGKEEVRLEWVANDADGYMLVLTPPVEGGAPVLWITPTEER